MVTKDIIEATYRIRVGSETGTAFAVNHHGSTVFVTARHMFSTLIDEFEHNPNLSHRMHVHQISISNYIEDDLVIDNVLVYFNLDFDIAVFTIDWPQYFRAIPSDQLSSKGIVLGEEVFLLGFPFIFDKKICNINPDKKVPFYLPIIKHGIISTFENEDGTRLLIDTHNNPGFSGGPVAKCIPGKGAQVIGVINGYYYDEYAGKVKEDSNSGFATVCPIKRALELFDFIDTFSNYFTKIEGEN